MAGANMARAQGDTSALLSASQMTDQVAERMKEHAVVLQSRLQPLEQAWVGKSSTAFQTFHTDYQTSMNRLQLKLKELAVQIRRTAAAHESADQTSNQKLASASGGDSPASSSLSANLNA
ncbi:WXG100 family type VII secretion target [Labedaea rhizosphaerae]|uniref:WXG100 family type VII secretion target n=1 Tax=Labedaea rhizosphaerae TaxID=598644 RepID=A0A4R6SLE5_LABRH|nr:WXG100 family type VII secretion target [Labedaea rhizosphaerae]TDQ04929.1 WXG100 family type VII secretion target [Labedaea rhizosphaerae]